MPRSIEEIQADIAKVKQEIALRDRYTQGFNQPRTSVGWGSYIVDGDRGLLDAYQGRESDWKKMMEQQEFQAAERALAQKFTAEQNALNRKNQMEVAKANKAEANDERKAAAEDRLAKLKITREQLKGQGHDTRDIDVDINRILKQYPDLTGDSTETPFDPKNTVEYKLGKYKAYDATHNSVEELEEAMNEIGNFDTPQAIELYVKLERERMKREKWDKSGESLKQEINAYNTSEGGLSTYLVNHGYSEIIVPNGYALVDPKGNTVKKANSKKGNQPSNPKWKSVK